MGAVLMNGSQTWTPTPIIIASPLNIRHIKRLLFDSLHVFVAKMPVSLKTACSTLLASLPGCLTARRPDGGGGGNTLGVKRLASSSGFKNNFNIQGREC